jgi:predicted lipid-binding transport protein (Tim44 family)
MDLESLLPSWLAALLPRRRRLKVATAREPGKNRGGTFSAVTFGAATIAFILALFGIGPFAVQELVVTFASSSGQIPASQVFPSVAPTHKVVNVYDPPKQQPAASPRPSSTASPAPSPSPSRRPTPPPDD